jgi:hypothetical protein
MNNSIKIPLKSINMYIPWLNHHGYFIELNHMRIVKNHPNKTNVGMMELNPNV